jgi:hypothetical protein
MSYYEWQKGYSMGEKTPSTGCGARSECGGDGGVDAPCAYAVGDGCPATDDVMRQRRWDDEDRTECCGDQMSRSHMNGWQRSQLVLAASGKSLLEQLRA